MTSTQPFSAYTWTITLTRLQSMAICDEILGETQTISASMQNSYQVQIISELRDKSIKTYTLGAQICEKKDPRFAKLFSLKIFGGIVDMICHLEDGY